MDRRSFLAWLAGLAACRRFWPAPTGLVERLRARFQWCAVVDARGQKAARENRTGTDLIAGLQASPCRDIDIEPERYRALKSVAASPPRLAQAAPLVCGRGL